MSESGWGAHDCAEALVWAWKNGGWQVVWSGIAGVLAWGWAARRRKKESE